MILESSTFIHTLESIDLCEATRYRKFPQEEEDIDSRNFSSADFDGILHSHIFSYFFPPRKKLMQCAATKR